MWHGSVNIPAHVGETRTSKPESRNLRKIPSAISAGSDCAGCCGIAKLRRIWPWRSHATAPYLTNVVRTFLCPRFWLQALNASGGRQRSWPRLTRVFLKLCGLKYGSPAARKESRNILLIGEALPQWERSSPVAPNWRFDPSSIRVDGKSGSLLLQSCSSLRQRTHSSTISTTSSPTGKKYVLNVLLNFVFTSRAS